MAFPLIPLPASWDVPNVPGVPALLGETIGNGVSAMVSTIAGRELAAWQIGRAAKYWGIFKGGDSVLTAAHVLGIEHEAHYQVSTAPTENGNFVSYNKAKLPYLTRILMVCDGSESGSAFAGAFSQGVGGLFKQVLGNITGDAPLQVRKDFFDTLEALVADTNLYDIHMPERSYTSANIVGYRFRRDERGGVTMPVVEIELQEIRTTATQGYRKTSGTTQTTTQQEAPQTQTVSASAPVQSGQVQLQALPNGSPDLTGIMSGINGA